MPRYNNKVKLKDEIKERLLASEELLGKVADKVRTSAHNIKRNIWSNSQLLGLKHYIDAIKEVLGLPEGEEITEPLNSEITQ